ncbi:MAG: exo-beta-N-acetylmuramidase NamZ domain-containing protein [Fluviicola sp.]
MRRYIKLLAIQSICLVFLTACGWNKSRHGQVVSQEEEDFVAEQVIQSEEDEIYIGESNPTAVPQLIIGNQRMNLYLDSLRGKRVAIVANQSSVINRTHLVDSLLALGITIQKVFAPEHGFRGTADAGEKIWSHKDPVTGLPIVSLYGNNKKPRADQLWDVDIVLFDIQDVGVRFYTYISTLHYVMEACAENKKPLIVLDRPNPNAHYIDGPVREPEHTSFIGMHPVPIVYGMTIGEYALMINGEFWLHNDVICQLYVVPCKNYNHKMKFEIPIAPSPNLRTDLAITLYPSLCFFEATTVSVGRGTERPFEMYGHPNFRQTNYAFIPMPTTGAKEPLWQNKICNGYDLRSIQRKRAYEINLNWLINARDQLGDSVTFIDQRNFFDRLAGTSELRKQLAAGMSAKEIKATWKPGIDQFTKIRQKYLIYN